MPALRLLLVLGTLVVLPGCELIASFDRDEIPLPGTGVPGIPEPMDAGDQPPPGDAGPMDAGTDAGLDAGVDGGPTDAGTDAAVDGGTDASVDAGPDAGPDAGGDAGAADAGADAGDAG